MEDADARAILREHGVENVPARGKLTGQWHERAAELAAAGASYDAGVTEGDFVQAGEPPPAEASLPAAERKPRRVRQATPRLRDRLRNGASAKPGKAKRKHPRVPVDRLIERGWEALARLAVPVSLPIARCLDMQAPVAGLIMEDIVRDTVVDRVLQPVARAEEKAEKVIALAAPPVLVGALQAAQGLPDDQRQIREALLIPLLRESLVIWVKIAGDKLEARQARELEMGPVNAKVDELLAVIFAPPPAAAGPAPEASPEMAGV